MVLRSMRVLRMIIGVWKKYEVELPPVSSSCKKFICIDNVMGMIHLNVNALHCMV
jgi:hypothetical protein